MWPATPSTFGLCPFCRASDSITLGQNAGGSQSLCPSELLSGRPGEEFATFSGKPVVVTSYYDRGLWNGICHTYLSSKTATA